MSEHQRPASIELRAEGSTGERLEAPEVDARGILAIDTALGTGAAFGLNGQIVTAVSDDQRGHVEWIGTLIDRVLEQAGVAPDAVGAVVAGVGPGPFTGLRVGLAAAHAFAAARAVPLLSLISHDAVALAALTGAASTVRVVQDAKRRELFVSDYSGLDWAGIPVRAAEPHIVPREGYASVPQEVWPERIPAARLVQLAARRLAAGREFEADGALYLRAPDVRQPGPVKRVST